MTETRPGAPIDTLHPPIQGLIVDMDGVLWKDATAIGDLPAIFRTLKSKRLQIVLATNNATLTVPDNLAKLRKFGVELEPWQVVTSSDALARGLHDRFPGRGGVFVLGEEGLMAAVRDQGFTVINDIAGDPPIIAVVAGLDRRLTFEKLSRATSLIRGGAAFYGTNPDVTFPTPGGMIPGAGSILAALAAASEVSPIVVGKPAPFLFQLAMERLHLTKEQILVVGDRLETDVDGGSAWGARTALVLSGVSRREQLPGRRPQPNLVATDLTQLLCP